MSRPPAVLCTVQAGAWDLLGVLRLSAGLLDYLQELAAQLCSPADCGPLDNPLPAEPAADSELLLRFREVRLVPCTPSR